MQFSNRFEWDTGQNKISQIADQKRKDGMAICDLTVSNPTKIDLGVDRSIDRDYVAISNTYQPASTGLETAKCAIVQYYQDHAIDIDNSQIVITASTSEAYTYLFRLLADAGDEILIPQPSYPLLDYLLRLDCIHNVPYYLRYVDGEWKVDLESVEMAITSRTRAVILVNPNNPTGSFIKEDEFNGISELCMRNNIPLIVDEVFVDYNYDRDRSNARSFSGYDSVPAFFLNGLSKSCGLPQMKLSWIIVSGQEHDRQSSLNALETIADMYLSVSTPIQHATASFFASRSIFQRRLLDRILDNQKCAEEAFMDAAIECLRPEGGWYGLLQFPDTHTDEEWAMRILQKSNVFYHPGYFYNFNEEAFLVFSLIIDPDMFKEGMKATKSCLKDMC